MTEIQFGWLLGGMTLTGIVVFVCLYFITAGYGQFRTKQWGWSINNKVGWVLMEVPAFLTMLLVWIGCGCPTSLPAIVLFGLFMLHYFQRTFIFPMLMNGNSRMPLSIMLMGVTFNIINGYIQGGGIFLFPPQAYQAGAAYLTECHTILGICVFLIGLGINWHSDHVIRTLRPKGDTRHYLPQKGMYRYVTSANYLGELTEWTGFAIAAGTPAAWVFVWWTAANLVPRAHAIHKKYRQEFGNEAVGKKKRIIPFIY